MQQHCFDVKKQEKLSSVLFFISIHPSITFISGNKAHTDSTKN